MHRTSRQHASNKPCSNCLRLVWHVGGRKAGVVIQQWKRQLLYKCGLHLTNSRPCFLPVHLLFHVLQLKSLDLCGLAAVSDALAPTLCALTNLVVLQLNRTSCSDTTIEYLTYGNRLHQWSSTAGQQGQHRAAGTAAAAPSGCGTADMQQQWPRWVGTQRWLEDSGCRTAHTHSLEHRLGHSCRLNRACACGCCVHAGVIYGAGTWPTLA